MTRDDDWRLPGLRDPGLLTLLATVFLLQLLAWRGLEGYQLADSVEYMERAQGLVRGEQVSVGIRSYGYVSLLAPFFLVADWLGAEDYKPVVALVRLFQMLLGLELVRVCVRIGGRLAGRGGGWVAGLVVGLNPLFLRYSISPVSDIAAAVCIGHALERLLWPTGRRAPVIGGLWLGGALILAYKTLLVSVPLLLLLLLRERLAGRRVWLGAGAGLGLGALAAVGLDRLCYGVWAASLDLYLRQNFGQIAARCSAVLGFDDLARWFWLYRGADGEQNVGWAAPSEAVWDIAVNPEPMSVLVRMPQMVVWPLLVFGLLGAITALGQRTRQALILLALLVIGIAGLSAKRFVTFRLMLPLLACIAPLCALGWRAWVEQASVPARAVRKVVALLLLLAGGVLGWSRLGELNTSRFAGYWRAMEIVDGLARQAKEEDASSPDWKVACAWHWAVFLRSSADVELVKLPDQLDGWQGYDEQQRRESLAALGVLDAFITHIAVLYDFPEVLAAVTRDFDVAAMLYDRATFEDSGPILVLTRRSDAAHALRLLELVDGVQSVDYIEEHGLEDGRRFMLDRSDPGGVVLTLLGWKYEPLPGDGHGWLSLHWLCEANGMDEELLVRPQLMTDARFLPWDEEHLLGRGVYPPESWKQGQILSEGVPVVAAVAPFDWRGEWRPLYAPDEDRSTVPASFWLRITPLAAGEPPLLPLSIKTGQPIRPEQLDATGVAPDGTRTLPEGFVSIGRLELIVPSCE